MNSTGHTVGKTTHLTRPHQQSIIDIVTARAAGLYLGRCFIDMFTDEDKELRTTSIRWPYGSVANYKC